MKHSIVLDTHALLWLLADDGRLSTRAVDAIGAADERLVSAVSFWEVAMLVEKGRVELDRPVRTWTNDVLAEGYVSETVLHADTAVVAGTLADFHGDPADRMIVAAAMAAGADLVTKDGSIQSWAVATGGITCIW